MRARNSRESIPAGAAWKTGEFSQPRPRVVASRALSRLVLRILAATVALVALGLMVFSVQLSAKVERSAKVQAQPVQELTLTEIRPSPVLENGSPTSTVLGLSDDSGRTWRIRLADTPAVVLGERFRVVTPSSEKAPKGAEFAGLPRYTYRHVLGVLLLAGMLACNALGFVILARASARLEEIHRAAALGAPAPARPRLRTGLVVFATGLVLGALGLSFLPPTAASAPLPRASADSPGPG